MQCSDYLKSVSVSMCSLIEAGVFDDQLQAEAVLSDIRNIIIFRCEGWL